MLLAVSACVSGASLATSAQLHSHYALSVRQSVTGPIGRVRRAKGRHALARPSFATPELCPRFHQQLTLPLASSPRCLFPAGRVSSAEKALNAAHPRSLLPPPAVPPSADMDPSLMPYEYGNPLQYDNYLSGREEDDPPLVLVSWCRVCGYRCRPVRGGSRKPCRRLGQKSAALTARMQEDVHTTAHALWSLGTRSTPQQVSLAHGVGTCTTPQPRFASTTRCLLTLFA